MIANAGAEILGQLERELTAQHLRAMDDTDLQRLSEQLWRWHDEALRELLKRGHVVLIRSELTMERQRRRRKAKVPAGAEKDRSDPKEPSAVRPTVPGYEFSAKKKRLLPWKWAVKRLEKSRQYWIATTRPDGAPHLMIIWGLWLDENFWFNTGSASRKARNLAASPQCAGHRRCGESSDPRRVG